MDIRSAIKFATNGFREKSIASARLDAEVLLLESLNVGRRKKKDKTWLYLNTEEYLLSPQEEKIFKSFVRRRKRLEPVAYIIGRKEFYGLDFFVDKDVLIPRPETEIIVEETLRVIRDSKDRFTLMDIGTGSGCIPISILKAAEASSTSDNIAGVFADDISERALRVAKKNARLHRVASQITFISADLEVALEKIKDAKNIIITANLPYISPEDYDKLTANVRKYEPKLALTTKDKGLHHIRRLIVRFAALRNDMSSYYMFLEADPKQMRSIVSLAKKCLPEADMEMIKDLRGKKRVMKIWKG
jgi:release factor glutamine methyltransferase